MKILWIGQEPLPVQRKRLSEFYPECDLDVVLAQSKKSIDIKEVLSLWGAGGYVDMVFMHQPFILNQLIQRHTLYPLYPQMSQASQDGSPPHVAVGGNVFWFINYRRIQAAPPQKDLVFFEDAMQVGINGKSRR